MVHPSTDNFSRLGLGLVGHPFYLGVCRIMRAIKIIAATLLVAAAAVMTTPGPGDREHLLQSDQGNQSDQITEMREHLL